MSEAIEIGDEVRTKVGKVLKVDIRECHLVLWQNGKKWWVPTGAVELVRKHNQPETAVAGDKWEGVKKVRHKYASTPRELIGSHGDWLWVKSCDVSGYPDTVCAIDYEPYTPPVEVGSRVKDCDGGIATVRYISGSEACLERGESEIWVVRVCDLTVIE